jgi:hypothetical protein
MKIISKLFFALAAIMLSVSICGAQTTEGEAKQVAESAVRAAFGLTQSDPLHVRRDEALEERLFALQLLVKGQIAQSAYFYRVTKSGYFIISPDEAMVITSTGYDEPYLVAVSVKTGQAYLLARSERVVESFNSLATESALRIDDELSAASLAQLFYKVAFDPDEIRIMWTAAQYRHRVEDHFISRYGEQESTRPFREWSRQFDGSRGKATFGVHATREDDSFRTTLTYSEAAKGVPALHELTLRISKRGTVTVEADRQIYPNVK